MSRSSKDSPTALAVEKPHRGGFGARPPGPHPSQADELTQDLIGSMKRLSRERRREEIAKRLF